MIVLSNIQSDEIASYPFILFTPPPTWAICLLHYLLQLKKQCQQI